MEFGGKGDAKKALDQWNLGQEDYPMVILPKRAWLVSKRKNFGFIFLFLSFSFCYFSAFFYFFSLLNLPPLDNSLTSQEVQTRIIPTPLPNTLQVSSYMSLRSVMEQQETNSVVFSKNLEQ